MREAAALGAARAALVRVAAALGTRDAGSIRATLEAAAAVTPHRAVDEVLLQSHLFVGFPDALEAMVLWREVSGSGAPAPSPEEPELWSARGPEICARVYGANYEKLRRNVGLLHPDLDRWMVEGGYGRVIGRAGLDLADRELCIAALLTTWGAPRQLHSHLRGALNAGARASELEAALEIACEYAGPEEGRGARVLLQRILGGSGGVAERPQGTGPVSEGGTSSMPERR